MKKVLALFLFFAVVGFMNAQTQMVNSFDAPQDSIIMVTSESADTSLAYLDLSYIDDPVHGVDNAMQMDYAVQNSEGWGGFYKMETWHPDTNSYYDFSAYNKLSIWYYNSVPQSDVGQVHLRVQFYDASNSATGANTYDANATELYYSFHYILDMEPGWNEIVMDMTRTDTYDGAGFTLTGWAGISGNGVLDLDKIKGYGIEFSIGGGGEGNISSGTIVLDDFTLFEVAENPLFIFNGKTVGAGFGAFTWGQSALELIEGGGEDPATNALLWTQGDEWANGWTGAGWNIDPAADIANRWELDSLKFKMKTEGTVAACRMQFESPAGVVGHAWDPVNDGEWHEYAIPLRDFYYIDGATAFDSSQITVFQFMAEGNSVAGNKVYFDYIWTGNPIIDLVPPAAPENVEGFASDTYLNVVSWSDVPLEEGETYNVYYSEDPIAEVDQEGVYGLALGVGEGIQTVNHVLIAPATDQTVEYYYAVTCADNFANVSPVGATATPTSNLAEGVTTIEPSTVAFAADGDLSEWSEIEPFSMYPDNGTGFVVTNTTIDGNSDLSVDSWVAIDEDYLYVAFDIEDDVVSNDTTFTSYLIDCPDLFIGLYDLRGESHTSYERGAEPDYHFRFGYNAAFLDHNGSPVFLRRGDADYYWEEAFPSGYTIEAKISLDELAASLDDARFNRLVGMRLPIDYSINDNDTPNSDAREGIMTYSPLNEDYSWRDVNRWAITWVGDQWVDVNDEDALVHEYKLSQNYPNPFNPSTTINYSLKENGFVTLKIYNILGQEMVTLVNKELNAGQHTVNFDASKLSSGVYIYQIQAGNFTSSKKMLLLK